MSNGIPLHHEPAGAAQAEADPATERGQRELLDLRSFFYQCPVGLFEIDDGGTVKMVNPAAVRMLAPVIGSGDLSQLFPILATLAPEVVDAITADPAQLGPLAAGRRILIRAGGNGAAYLELQAVRVAPGQVMIVLQDVTAERRLALRETEIAVELQLAMLGHADEIAAMPVGVTYRAAEADLQVGGDWYDVIGFGDGLAALMVGDAVGHTLAATTAMGQLRSALRATTRFCREPAQLLEQADAIAGQTDGAECSTVAYALVDLASGQLAYASAGHPPILIVHADGSTGYLPGGRGLPLGIAPCDRAGAVCQLAAGDLVVMYTDGLYERRDAPADEQLARLAALAGAAAALPPTELSRALAQGMLTGTTPEDDVCVLVAAPQIMAERAGLTTQLTTSGVAAELSAPARVVAAACMTNHGRWPREHRGRLESLRPDQRGRGGRRGHGSRRCRSRHQLVPASGQAALGAPAGRLRPGVAAAVREHRVGRRARAGPGVRPPAPGADRQPGREPDPEYRLELDVLRPTQPEGRPGRHRAARPE